MTWLDYFSQPIKIESTNRGASIIKLKARTMINALESKPFNFENEKIQNILDDSNTYTVRRKLSSLLTHEGKAAVGIVPGGKSYLLVVYKVLNFNLEGNIEKMIEGETESTYYYEGRDYPIIAKWYFKDNTPILERYIKIPKDENEIIVPIGNPHVFKSINYLPIELFINNEDMEGDAKYAEVDLAIKRIDDLDGSFMEEWNISRALPYVNSTFNVKGEREMEDIKSGTKRTIVDKGYNAQYGSSMQIIPANQSTSILLANILTMEDDIYKKLGLKRDTQQTGTNKHGLEIALTDEFMLSDLFTVRSMREKHYQTLIDKLAKLIGETSPKVNLELSDLVTARLEFLKASIAAENAKSQNITSQPDKNTNEGETNE